MTDEEDRNLDNARRAIELLRKREGGEYVCSDDLICPPGLTITHGKITVHNPALVCTMPNNHPGDHEAHGYLPIDGEAPILTWRRGEGRAG